MRLYRSMREAPDGFPEAGPGGRLLGVRPGSDPTPDVLAVDPHPQAAAIAAPIGRPLTGPSTSACVCWCSTPTNRRCCDGSTRTIPWDRAARDRGVCQLQA